MSEVRSGRPPKVDESGVATRERLLAAAVASCVDHGFDGATVADIARRADVSAPAIYNHFGGKVELMVAAGRAALDRLTPRAGVALTPVGIVRAWTADDFAETRRLLAELHLAALRHPDVADLLAKWHGDHAAEWARRLGGADALATVKTFFAVLLGICHLDSMSSIAAPTESVRARLDDVATALFPDPPDFVTTVPAPEEETP